MRTTTSYCCRHAVHGREYKTWLSSWSLFTCVHCCCCTSTRLVIRSTLFSCTISMREQPNFDYSVQPRAVSAATYLLYRKCRENNSECCSCRRALMCLKLCCCRALLAMHIMPTTRTRTHAHLHAPSYRRLLCAIPG